MITRPLFFRRAADAGIKAASGLAALTALFFLGWIIIGVAARGLQAWNLAFFTHRTAPPGITGGGVANAIVGSLLITLLAMSGGVPLGLMAGVYLAEFGKHTHLGTTVRFIANVLMGVPSIIIGLFVYAVIVAPMKTFSAYAGAGALAIIILPIVARTTEDMLGLVPASLRESALALGAPRWKVTLGILFRAAKSGLITGIILALARVAGETAPLLFTALNSPYWPRSLREPMANLTVTIFNYAMSPYQDWQRTAWGAAFLIMTVVLTVNILTRMLFKEAKK
jgi:phosphate transport system permease protein